MWLVSGTLRIKRQHLGIDTLAEALVRYDPDGEEGGSGEGGSKQADGEAAGEEEGAGGSKDKDKDGGEEDEGEEGSDEGSDEDGEGRVDPDELLTPEERGPAALNEIMTKLLLPGAKEVNRLEVGEGFGPQWWEPKLREYMQDVMERLMELRRRHRVHQAARVEHKAEMLRQQMMPEEEDEEEEEEEEEDGSDIDSE